MIWARVEHTRRWICITYGHLQRHMCSLRGHRSSCQHQTRTACYEYLAHRNERKNHHGTASLEPLTTFEWALRMVSMGRSSFRSGKGGKSKKLAVLAVWTGLVVVWSIGKGRGTRPGPWTSKSLQEPHGAAKSWHRHSLPLHSLRHSNSCSTLLD